ncbi:hypothetical protein Xinn_04090 [Xenorhabdus innexi]|uniref:Uncharacterized protein n=1 Tax=Xenorhabdus innexi TaxID=290109 RepID=A0A2G0MNL3_9GAMM|nr:hypothetical protein Xinn_04090 [Xenorhabdus innexi]
MFGYAEQLHPVAIRVSVARDSPAELNQPIYH